MEVIQLWIIIGLLALIAITHVLMGLRHLQEHKKAARKEKLNVQYTQGDFDMLLSETQEALAEFPNHVEALYYRGKTFHNQGRLEEARELYVRLANSDPEMRRSANDLIALVDRDLKEREESEEQV